MPSATFERTCCHWSIIVGNDDVNDGDSDDGDDAEDNDKSGDDDIEMEEEAANKVLPEDLRATSNLQNSSRTLIEQSRILMMAMDIVIIMKVCWIKIINLCTFVFAVHRKKISIT